MTNRPPRQPVAQTAGRTVRPAIAALAAVTLGSLASPAAAAPSQDEVFRSIQHNVGGGGGGNGPDVDPMVFLLVLGGVIGLVVLGSLVGNRKRGRAAPTAKPRNHQGKLLREVLRAVPLKGREMKQLKALAEHAGAGEPLVSPLTLMLCPSVMAKTLQQGKRMKVDRRALAAVARKAGLQVTRK